MPSFAKLKWRCRRGTQELDKLLLNYLEKHYFEVSFTEQQQFQQLLNLPDSDLLKLFFSEQNSKPHEFDELVEKIRSATVYHP